AAAAAAQPEVVYSCKFAGVPYPHAAITGLDSVRWIHVAGAGFDHLEPWDRDRMVMTNSAGSQGEAMGQYVLGAVYGLNFRYHTFLRQQADHVWRQEDVHTTLGKTMLIVGLGRIGRVVARYAQSVGMTVIGVRTRAEPVAPVDEVHAIADLKAVLPKADYVVVLTPLNETTRGLFDGAALAAMKPGAYLIHIARGGIVDEAALVQSLAAGHLGGAVVDVFDREPLPPESPLWTAPNLIVTPHVAAIFVGWQRACFEIFVQNLALWRDGKPLINRVGA
ncbi:MAG: D-2-hydroxyacid dehydrogenase, partial [Alphaproteobacteria bacterium]